MTLMYQGKRIARWHESLVSGELRVTLIIVDPSHPSGKRAVVLAGREAVALKLASQKDIEAMGPLTSKEGEE